LSTPIAVFGSSEPVPGEPAYELAERVGSLLGGAGYPVVTGGYGGVMEAASRGATAAGGRAIGVTCATFEDRAPNVYLTEVHEGADLHDRTRQLIDLARGFVVLEGKAGTLAELAFLWALQRAGCLGTRPVVLLGDSYRNLLAVLERSVILEPEQLKSTRLASSPEEVLRMIDRSSGRGAGRS
jgi:uncharacterized protein (TIGR00730 family)